MWQLLIDQWLSEQNFESVPGLPQVFVLRDKSNAPSMIIAKIVDDFLCASDNESLERFSDTISRSFKVGKFCTNESFIFNGARITQLPDKITLEMDYYMENIHSIDICRARRKQKEEKCSEEEHWVFPRLTGQLNFLGHSNLPQAEFVASHLQKSIGNLTVEDLITANNCLHEPKQFKPLISFLKPSSFNTPEYLAFSDASMGKYTYEQTGYVSGIYLTSSVGKVYHVIDWDSGKQSRV